MLTQKIAEFVVNTKPPAEALHCATNALIDTMGCALVGATEPISDIARSWVTHLESKPVATIWGTKLATSASEAAFVNGIASHADDYDDTHPSLRGHPSAALIPTVVSTGESVHASGAAVLAAHAVGLEIAGKLAKAVGDSHYFPGGWHNTATVGVFSCTAAAARLLGLDVNQLCNAWGLAASQSAGLVRNFGTMTKAFAVGNAARSGIHAAWLARHGYTADAAIWEGEGSFLAVYGRGDGLPLPDLAEKLGDPWEIVKPGINCKRWPCCYQVARPVVGVMDLLSQHNISTGEIESIAIGFPPGSASGMIHDDPHTGLEGKFSTQYTVAAYVLDRKLNLDSYTDAMLHRPEVRTLMRKVKRYEVPDTKICTAVIGYTDVEIVTKRGTFKRRVQQTEARAAEMKAAWIDTDAGHDEKFLDCASGRIGAERAKYLLSLARNCANLPDIAEFARAAAGIR